ncbi:EAL domain-containing protein [Pseudoduganella namucuonensis]|uniref:Diguanylate cyclase/phosphodiesterase with PAS/PAC sensor(S) n=1 Tax=Pseudoduganella namucuonensis TaxID=1035707 RepID=A0A1I7LYX7_9BURK|nr:EAL domain-containing protein [Pseudoduganella namucuonensis]SFV14911.1 diguanylate cyclase/phosphodiesterase with PAS/PAC sensor(s) [Pseudoduganella namucuonensis]
MKPLDRNEQARLAELYSFNILDTPADAGLGRLAGLAARQCGMPIAVVTMVDADRQWYKCAIGLDFRQTCRSISFCARTVEAGEPLVVGDARRDPRFERNPLVTGPPHLVFYAGVPLTTARHHVLGALAVFDTRPRAITPGQLGLLEVLAEQVMARLELRRHAALLEALRASGERYMHAARASLWDWQLPGTRIEYGERFRAMLGYSAAEFPDCTDSLLAVLHPDDRAATRFALARHLRRRRQEPVRLEFRLRTRARGYRWLETTAQGIWAPSGRPLRVVGSTVDIHERKVTTVELARSNRALQMLSRCNEEVTRAADEPQLVARVCRLAVELGGYDMAWVSQANDDAARSIKPVAWYPDDERGALLAELPLTWSLFGASGEPCGQAVLSGQPVVCADFPAALGEAAPALRRAGFQTLVALPLRDKDHNFGLVALMSAREREVSPEEVCLLRELVDDLAIGIANLRAESERDRLRRAVVKVAAGVCARSGTAFFESLLGNLGEAVGARASFVARLLPGEPPTARTLVAMVDGRLVDNFDYRVAGSPCENLAGADHWVVTDRLRASFPPASPLGGLAPSAYAGQALIDSSGQRLGFLCALFAEPLQTHDVILSTMRIFAARVAFELEREIADARILDQAALLDKAQDAIIARGLDSTILFWNKGAERLYGWAAEEAIGRSLPELVQSSGGDLPGMHDDLMRRGECSGELEQRRKDGGALVVEGRWSLVRDSDGAPKSVLEINTDISRRKADERQIRRLAFYDSLTGLPNRALLLDRLGHAFAACGRARGAGALLFIDLDNFKSLNDTLGHDQGDVLLRQVAGRLRHCVRTSDTVARLGGDEFVILMENLPPAAGEASSAARLLADKILAAFVEVFALGITEHRATPSIGIALFDGRAGSIDELLRWADLAMYQAKAAGRNTMRFFDPRMQAAVSSRVALEADLRNGLLRGEFVVYHQPQFDTHLKLIGAEALVRWRHPARGLICPGEFIALAEETGLIVPLGGWMLERACAHLARWARRAETRELTLAANVSIRQFRQAGFVEEVLDVLARTGANPARLKLELTESLLISDVESTVATMAALKRAGVGFSLDDFGTGYSSLAYLKRLPLDQLKIDRSFVRDITTDANDAAIARTIIALGHSLGLAIIAEGVETEEQRQLLQENGCDAFQGFLLGPPAAA